MSKSPQKKQPITNIPLTAESREDLLEALFSEELPHPGELFIPDDNFYLAEATTIKRAKHMVRALCTWLGIKPGYIGLEFESGYGEKADGTRHTLYIETAVQNDEFVLGAFLTYSLTRYLIEERKQIRLSDVNQQAALIANASVMFGLSIVVLNGLRPKHSWLSNLSRSQPAWLKGFPYANYIQLSRSYLRKYRLEPAYYNRSLAPWAARDLNVAVSKQPFHAIRDLTHQFKIANAKMVGVSWILLVALGIGAFTFAQRVKPIPMSIREAEQTTALLSTLVKICQDELTYNRSYADYSDIQTIRALNAAESRCQSLQNQYESAQQKIK